MDKWHVNFGVKNLCSHGSDVVRPPTERILKYKNWKDFKFIDDANILLNLT